MRLARSPAALAALAVAFLSSKAAGLAFVLPATGALWDLTGATSNVISWSLLPLTYPEPTSKFFDIWIVNAAPGMYSPTLDTILAANVDASGAVDTYIVPLATALELVPGPGYTLLFTQPGDVSVVYADSPVFNIGTDQTPTTGAVSTSYDLYPTSVVASSAVVATSSVALTSSVAAVTSSAAVAASTSGMATSVVAKATSSSATVAVAKSTAQADQILPAKIVGGWEDQGRTLLTAGGERVLGARVGMAVAVAAGLAGLGWVW